jgi:hypothetical protein
MEAAFAKLIYWYVLHMCCWMWRLKCYWLCCLRCCCCDIFLSRNTKSTFDSELAVFMSSYKNACLELLEYFVANWKPCALMWANHARGKFFTAGNTTTNRIETNCNQVKLVLRKRPRLDATISGFLAHQATNTQLLLTATRKHSTTSRHPELVPGFLLNI